MLIFKVVQTISALALATLHQIVEEGVVGSVAVTHALHFDHLFVLDVEDDVAMLFPFLNLIKLILTFLSHSHS